MTSHPEGMATESQAVGSGPIRIGGILLGLATFFALITVVPLGWALFVPLDVSAWALWVCLASAVALTCLLGTIGQPKGRRGAAAVIVGLVLAAVVLSVAGGCAALDAIMGDFSQTTTDARVVSPNGHLVATQVYADVGATGGTSSVDVRGRFVPGLLTWDYEVPIPDDAYPESLAWRDDRTVVVDGMEYPIPEIVVRLSW
jgi:hypothetical protein